MITPDPARPTAQQQMATGDNNNNAMDREHLKKQEALVSRFASLLGTGQSEGGNRRTDLTALLAKSVGADSVVCTIPSLDMKLDDLPEVGEHRKDHLALHKQSASLDEGMDAPSSSSAAPAPAPPTPVMEASILSSASSEASADAAVLEQKAAQRLCTKTSWTKSTVSYAPGALSKNVVEAFSSLVDSRVKAWTLLLFRHSLSSGDAASRSRLLSMLSASIKVNSTLTSLKTLPLPESAAGQPKEADVILPLLFEVHCNIELKHRTDKVTLRAPGTISGHFVKGPAGESTMDLEKVDVNLDTGALLASMIDQARLAVFKTVAKVTSTDANATPSKSSKATAVAAGGGRSETAAAKLPTRPNLSASTLASFSSSLRLPPSSSSSSSAGGPNAGGGGQQAQSPRLEKAHKSALRLNSVLHGKSNFGAKSSDPSTNIRKNRSVQWDHPMQMPSVGQNSSGLSNKRLRIAHTSARLKSFKSFGRPHAGDFGSGPRNATFGEFGSGGAGAWGRDGKMVHHPSPMDSMKQDSIFAPTASSSGVSRNASFSLSKHRNSLASSVNKTSSSSVNNPLLASVAGGRGGLGSSSSRGGGLGRVGSQNGGMGIKLPSTLPRTATALESWFIKAHQK